MVLELRLEIHDKSQETTLVSTVLKFLLSQGSPTFFLFLSSYLAGILRDFLA